MLFRSMMGCSFTCFAPKMKGTINASGHRVMFTMLYTRVSGSSFSPGNVYMLMACNGLPIHHGNCSLPISKYIYISCL